MEPGEQIRRGGPKDLRLLEGVTDLALGVLPGSVGAMRLYERRGYRPTWMYMSRFG